LREAEKGDVKYIKEKIDLEGGVGEVGGKPRLKRQVE